MIGVIVALLWASVALAETTHSPCDFKSDPAVKSGDHELARKVETLFATSCKKCHGLNQTGGAFVMTDVMDRDLLVREGMVDLIEPSRSKIIQAVNRPERWMPLGGDRLADSDIQAILAWVEAGAPDWKEPEPSADRPLTHLEEVSCIAYDQAKFTEKDAYYVRYLTLGHLKGKEFTVAQAGVTKLVNHLTFATKPKAPRKVDSFGKILAIDFRDYEPNLDFFAWEKLIIPGYPYAYLSFDDKLFNFYVDKINRYAYSERAFIRGDWFIDQTAQSPGYEQVLRLPKTLQELEKVVLGLDVDKELTEAYAKRGSVQKSGVTNYPRLVDRFDLEFFLEGQFVKAEHWITRDFNSDKGTSNIYAFPFGPRILQKYHGWDDAQFFAAKVFENQAGESITRLPNGFQFYGIWDGRGSRLDKADPHIAVDKSGLFDDLTVRNGISCMYCHAGGPNPFDDDSVIRHIRQSPSFTVAEVDFAERLFFTKPQRDEAFGQHAKAFKTAMEAVGLTNPEYLTPNGEPISQAFRKFTGYMSCQDLAWELGLSLPVVEKYLHHSPDLARELGLADCGVAKLSRENYEHLFFKIVKEFDIGLQVKVGQGHVVNKCGYTIKNLSNRTVKYTVNFGKDEIVQVNHGASKSWEFDDKLSGQVFKIVSWDGWKWVNYNLSYQVSGCQSYTFKWSQGAARLFVD